MIYWQSSITYLFFQFQSAIAMAITLLDSHYIDSFDGGVMPSIIYLFSLLNFICISEYSISRLLLTNY